MLPHADTGYGRHTRHTDTQMHTHTMGTFEIWAIPKIKQ